VIGGVPPQGGGPTNAVFGLVRTVRDLGVDAEVATTDSNIWGNLSVPLGERIVERGVPIIHFRSPAFRKYGFSPDLAGWLRAHVGAYDLLHIHGVFAHPTIAAARAAARARIPYIVRPCGELDPWPLRKNRLLKWGFLRALGFRILHRAAAVHATSEMEALALKRLGIQSPIVTIPLGVDYDSMDSGVCPGEFRAAYPECDGKKIILFLSRIDPKKGVDLLLGATEDLARKRQDFVLVIAGSGAPSFEEKVRAQVAGAGLDRCVKFCGFLNEHWKLAALGDADLFVLPSYDENFGMAVVEAMAAGLPVVVSDQVGIHREIQEAAAGVVTRCDPREIAAALERLLDDESLRRRMGENGRHFVQEKFTWSRVGAELVKLYEGVAAGLGRGS
jgi:glycosyltransferase involved in cell wall biosynthesis